MDSLDLFTPLARSADPETSAQGETRANLTRGSDRWRVYQWYLANPRGATAAEYFRATKDETGRKRCSDLLALGWLRDTGERRDGGRVLVAVP